VFLLEDIFLYTFLNPAANNYCSPGDSPLSFCIEHISYNS